MTATADRSEMLFLGSACHHPACHLNDFLPFTCPACHQTFCQPHFLPSQHGCTAPLPPSMIDRIAPQCPMCNSTVPTVPNDPNAAVERHILSGTCPGMEGGEARKRAELRRKKDLGQICWKKGCTKAIVVPMKCDQCDHTFCPTHRHSTVHSCTPTPTSSRNATPQPGPSSAPKAAAAKAALSRLVPSSNKSSGVTAPASSSAPKSPRSPIKATNVIDAKAAAAAAALKRAGNDAKVPFVKTKTEKRAQAESSSQLQAMKNRHDKGLLSKTEEVKYAQILAEKESGRRKSEGKGKDGCIVG